jgi:N-methylhydantoinase A
MPTVTDADLLLGWLDPADFAGGSIALSPEASKRAMASHLEQALNMSSEQAAYGITEIVSETMANAARVHAVENGKETSDRTLIAFGGAAPLHAARLAQKLGIRKVVIPRGAGVGSAHGFLEAPLGYEIVQTKLTSLSTFDPAAAEERFARMRAEAESVVRLGQPKTALVERRVGFMRYRGQGHEVAVPLPPDAFGAQGSTYLREAFETAYRQLYGRVIPNLDIEILTWVLSLAESKPLPSPVTPIDAGFNAEPTARRSRDGS